VTTIIFDAPAGADAAVALSGSAFPGSDKPPRVAYTARPGGKKRAAKAAAAAAAAAPAVAADGGAPRGAGRARRVEVTAGEAATEASVRAFFDAAGAINAVVARGGGSFTVSFAAPEGADAAIAKSGSTLDGAPVTVVPLSARKRRGGGGDGAAPAAAAEPGAGRRRRAAPDASSPEVANLVWIGGLAEGADEASVRSAFAGFGAIESVSVRANRVKTFAYVKYAAAEGAEAAIAAPPAGLVVQKASRSPAPAA
jgi:hypothetical protein